MMNFNQFNKSNYFQRGGEEISKNGKWRRRGRESLWNKVKHFKFVCIILVKCKKNGNQWSKFMPIDSIIIFLSRYYFSLLYPEKKDKQVKFSPQHTSFFGALLLTPLSYSTKQVFGQ